MDVNWWLIVAPHDHKSSIFVSGLIQKWFHCLCNSKQKSKTFRLFLCYLCCFCLFYYLPVYMCLPPSTYLPCLAIYLPACLPAYLHVYLSDCLPVCLPVCLSSNLSTCLPACLAIYLPAYPTCIYMTYLYLYVALRETDTSINVSRSF